MTCKKLLIWILEHNDDWETKVNVIVKNISCDFNRLSAGLSNCASLLEISLIESGAILGKEFILGFTKCYSL